MFATLSVACARALCLTLAIATVGVSLAYGSDADAGRSGEQTPGTDQIRLGTRQVELLVTKAPPRNGKYRTFTNTGSGSVRVSVATLNGGALTAGNERDGRPGYSIRTPRFNPSTDAPRAAVKITNATATDVLNPRSADFKFGADFVVDDPSWRTASGSTDNGDNLVQRGLYGDASQYKLQVDRDVATCRIKGDLGTVEVSSEVNIQSGRWYRVRCRRLSRSVTISVTSWRTNGTRHTDTDTRNGRTGDMTPNRPSWPFSVGGKLRAGGKVHPSTDQFNGRIDNVFLKIG
ncbi:MAG: hypothetical protein H0V49_11685 [Nocardioidaceae bacterium]|nr:hypothetical protein [Nocardioidaceae bacterium]